MAKDIDNANIYDLGEVWIAEKLTTVDPEPGEEFGEGWTEVGLLDGDDGFSTSRDQEKNKHYAWGDILVREARKNFSLSRTFAVLEDNKTTRRLIWPGSTSKLLVTPKPKPIKVAFVKHDGDITTREITRKHAIVDVDGSIDENETDLKKVTLVADIYPEIKGRDGEFFSVQKFDADGKPVDDDDDEGNGGGEPGEG